MIFYFTLYFFIALVSMFIIDFSTTIMGMAIYVFGLLIVVITNLKDQKIIKSVVNIYQLIYIFGSLYIVLSYVYMNSHGYEYLLSPDIHDYFIPTLESYLEYNSIRVAEVENWTDFNFFSRYHSGYFGYLIPFGYFSSYLDANLYVGMQFTTLLVASLSGVVIFRIFLVNQVELKKAYKYTILICLFSILFFYSTQLLRDTHIMFFYLLGIYLTFKKEFSIAQLLKLLIVIGISCTLRIETGLFLFLLIPVYLLLSMQQSRKKAIIVLISLITTVIGISISTMYFNQITSVLFDNNEIYLESSKGDGIVGNLQKIPIIGGFLSIIYNAVQPLPFWSPYEAPLIDNRPEIYNIITFPLSFASFFNWIVILYIFYFLTNKKIRAKVILHISTPLRYQLYLGFIYLFIQSAVIDKRRLMAYYVIFYIFFYIIYINIEKKKRQEIMIIAASSYVFLQIIAFLYAI